MAEPGRVLTETVEVGRAGDRALLADLYRPPSPNGVGIVLIHGGSFIQGDRAQLRGYGVQMGRIGYTSLACEYRLAPDHKWPAQIDDVHTALGYLHSRASELALDPASVVSWGNSAGGQLAMMTAALGRYPVAAVVAFYAASDFLGPGARAHGAPEGMQFLMGDDISETRLKSISPINYATKEFPPTILMTGDNDDLVDWRDSVSMYLALKEAGASAELHVFDGAPHAFDAQPEYGRRSVDLVAHFLDRVVNKRI